MRGPWRTDRIRSARTTTFGWIDHRLRPWLASMSTDEQAVYLFLVLAADRDGVSWYGHATIGRALAMDPGAVRRAVGGLERLDLAAYRPWREGDADGMVQLLSVPPRAPAGDRRLGATSSVAALLPGILRRGDS